ncbi:MAG: hypothetical protein J5I65_15995 [Aridibacter famidurans]|nr:hypothetical protein [Aridibacter famidurans]
MNRIDLERMTVNIEQADTPQGASDQNEEESLLARYLARRVRDRASGRAEDECVENHPHDVYFVGNLRPRPAVDEHDNFLSELINKLAPTAFGTEFVLRPTADSIIVNVTLRWACYYRVFPTLEQQRSRRQNEGDEESTETRQNAESERKVPEAALEEEDREVLERQLEEEDRRAEEESPEVTESAAERRRNRHPTDSLFIRFRKIECVASGPVILQRAEGETWTANWDALQAGLDEETHRAQQVALDDPDHFRTDGAPDARVRIPEENLSDQAAYDAFLVTLDHDVTPEWSWQVSIDFRPPDDENADTIVPIFEFVNVSPTPDHRNAPNNEPFLFDAEATFAIEDAEPRPFEIELAPQGFRYDRHAWGRGFNCSLERDDAAPDRLYTTHTPIYEQLRYTTQSEPEASFAALAADPVPVLTEVLEAMESYRDVWEHARSAYEAQDPGWRAEHGDEFDRDVATFEREIETFRRGLTLIDQDPDVRLAFRLTNESFRRLGAHPTRPKTAWRLFQIVFIVSQIPGIVALRDPNGPNAAEREQVDIIYFATGGGKTEAYLGTTVFHCFFDRLRGKTAGVTAWTRFPLRLLTLQQTQRMADAIGVAELVRREQTNEPRLTSIVDSFAVGYFVGSEATPNEILNPEDYTFAQPKDRVTWSHANDPEQRQHWQRVITCPACRTDTVRVDFDADRVRVVHHCTNDHCAFPDGEIPVYVVDNEIYRYLPAVIVGTIDKLAGLGNQRKFSQLLGHVTGRCTLHGYYAEKCCQKDCEWRQIRRREKGMDQPAPEGLSGPTLFIQDELHLLKEGLGTFDGHYETFTQRLCAEFGQDSTLKIIASSATIEAFERQVEHLYGRDRGVARRFPGPGPTLQESFYAQTRDYPQRLFVGILPHNKTIFNTILELIELYHRETQLLRDLPAGKGNPYGGTLQPSTPVWNSLLDNYLTSLTYFLATRELDAINTDLEGDTNGRLRQNGLNPLTIQELTGGTSTAKVTRILARLERTANPDVTDAVLATSMVSHGVDVDRFNAMIFYGMPRMTAEYIQASSRVGRAHVGLVFTCLHPARERDRSHYVYFKKYHEYLGQLVEPVAINRWATFSMDRTLPGLFMGILLQLHANLQEGRLENNLDRVSPGKYYRREFVAKEITAGRLTEADFIPMLEAAYLNHVGDGVDPDEYRDKIRHQVQSFLYDQILPSQAGFVSETLNPKPMRSLRDVDEPVQIELDQDGTEWTQRMSSASS